MQYFHLNRHSLSIFTSCYSWRICSRRIEVSIWYNAAKGWENRGSTYTQEEDNDVAANKAEENTQISPAMVKAQTQRGVKLVTNAILAIFAVLGRVGDQVTRSSPFEERLHVFAASRAVGSGEAVQLTALADDLEIMERSGNASADETSEWIQLVEPRAPAFGHLRGRDSDTTEESKDDGDERIKLGGDTRWRRECGETLAEGDGEQLSDENHEELEASARRSCLEARHEVQRQVEADRTQNGVRHLGENDGRNEWRGGVHLGWGFAEE